MKVTPFVLFLIILIVLVISIIIGRKIGREGFISYQKQTDPGNFFVIPTYSKSNSLYKLYDNLYFDANNANVIEIDSPQYNNTPDTIGNTILTTSIITRTSNGTYSSYSGNVNVLPSIPPLSTSITSSYNNFVYNTQSKNTDKYCLLYIPWDIDTYMHIINVTSKKHIGTYIKSNSSFSNIIYNIPDIRLTTSSVFTDPNNNTLVLDNYYDNQKTLYQISKNVKYDITNGTLILETSTNPKTISIYTRDNLSIPTVVNAMNTISNTSSSVKSIGFTPTVINDKLGNNIILYLPNGTNTVIAIIGLSNDMSSFQLNNVVRFTANTVDLGSGSSAVGSVSLFNSFLTNFWKSQNKGQGNPYGYPYSTVYDMPDTYFPTGGYSNDYILKTQVVPPVCPSCPSCAAGSVCSNCGGNGGSGTKTNDGKTMVTGNGGSDSVGRTAELLENTGSGAVGLLKDTGSGAVGLAKSTGSGAVGLLKDTGSGAVGLLKDTGSGAVGLAKSTGSGAVGLLKDTGSGIMNMSNNRNYGSQGGNQSGGQGGSQGGSQGGGQGGGQRGYSNISAAGPQSMDQYSYYGALPNKETSDFMPVTADFSSFRH